MLCLGYMTKAGLSWKRNKDLIQNTEALQTRGTSDSSIWDEVLPQKDDRDVPDPEQTLPILSLSVDVSSWSTLAVCLLMVNTWSVCVTL